MTENIDDLNKDELEAPSWMNDEFFEGVLRRCKNDDSILVREVNITPASAKGDHYASVMFRGTIGYDSKTSKGNTQSLIIKTMPELDGHKKEMLGKSRVFETEIAMYSETIPKFEAELRKIGDNTVLGAKVLFHSLEPRKCIIFEDIVPKGYEVLRDRFLDMTEAKAALLKLAKWHAVSYKLASENDKSVTAYRDGVFSIEGFETEPAITTGMDNFIDIAATIDELKIYIPKLRSIQKDLIKRSKDSFNSYRQDAAKGVFVLCHGDFHAKNMMFKRNIKGELDDVMLLDFQVCYFGPAVLDIMYAMYMLLGEDLRKNHREELIYYYSSNFIKSLEVLGYQGEYPKVADFYIDILRHRHWELFLLVTFLPIWYGLMDKALDPEEMMTSDDSRKILYYNSKYIDEVKRILPIMLHNGCLD